MKKSKGHQIFFLFKPKAKQCWHFVPCITIKENEDTYAFNRKLVQHGMKLE
jgi:hypothetical protein